MRAPPARRGRDGHATCGEVSRPPDGPAVPPAPPVTAGELALVLLATVGLIAWARALPYDDWPLGDGWNRYLGNAIAVAERDWRGYLPWRGPVHAWLCLLLTPLAGSLVRASQWLSLLTTAALVPLAWALGRSLGGRAGGLLAPGLLLAWPDLRIFAWYSAPYPLQGVLVAGGALLAARPGRAAPVLAGLCLGLGAATDARAGLTGGLVLLGLAAGGRRALARSLVAGAVAWGAAAVLVRLIPVPLYSLGELALLQSGHVAPLVPECPQAVQPIDQRALGWREVLGPCGMGMVRLNLAHLAAATPIPAVGVAALGLLGALPGPGRPLAPRLAALLPVLALVPALALVAIQHRYLVPVAPFAAALIAAGLVRLTRGTRAGIGVAALVVLAAGAAWHLGGPTLLTRGGGVRGSNATADLQNPGTVVLAARAVRDGHADGERVVDCANGNLRERLWPVAVETMKPRGAPLPDRCRAILEAPAVPAWVFVRGGDRLEPGPGWTPVLGTAPGPRLYHGE